MPTNFKHEDRSLQRPKKKNRTVAKARAAKRRASERVKRSAYNLVWERDKGRCRACDMSAGMMHCHHVQYRSLGGEHSTQNVLLLCADCHEKIHRKKLFPVPNDEDRGIGFVNADKCVLFIGAVINKRLGART